VLWKYSYSFVLLNSICGIKEASSHSYCWSIMPNLVNLATYTHPNLTRFCSIQFKL
jgi:hypothetical protein